MFYTTLLALTMIHVCLYMAMSLRSGVVRFGRAVYHSFRVTADYKSTLRDLTGEEYEARKAEVHLRAAKRLLKVCNNIARYMPYLR
jgi:hypothetical protein